MHGNLEVGSFSITFGNPWSCNISILGEDTMYKNKGLAKFMIACVCLKIITTFVNIRSDQLIFIDADASDGFWDHVGFVVNRHELTSRARRSIEGQGYEKYITFGKLSRWSLNEVLGSSGSLNYLHNTSFGKKINEINYLLSIK